MVNDDESVMPCTLIYGDDSSTYCGSVGDVGKSRQGWRVFPMAYRSRVSSPVAVLTGPYREIDRWD
jgi:hypothetical protein